MEFSLNHFHIYFSSNSLTPLILPNWASLVPLLCHLTFEARAPSFFLSVFSEADLPLLSLRQVDPRGAAPQRFSRPHHHERGALPLHHLVRPRPESHRHGRGLALLLPGGRRVLSRGTAGGSGPQRHPGRSPAGGGGGFQQLHPRQDPAGDVCRYTTDQQGALLPPARMLASAGGKSCRLAGLSRLTGSQKSNLSDGACCFCLRSCSVIIHFQGQNEAEFGNYSQE